jgi:hypothetical protein
MPAIGDNEVVEPNMIESNATQPILRSGGCLCGQFRFTATGEPEVVGLCHCKDCQRQTTSAFSIIAVYEQAAIAMTGRLSGFTTIGEFGRPVRRSFCPECGAGVISEADFFPGKSLVKCGSFDDTDWVKPVFSLYCDSAQPWQILPETKLAFPRMFVPPG